MYVCIYCLQFQKVENIYIKRQSQKWSNTLKQFV